MKSFWLATACVLAFPGMALAQTAGTATTGPDATSTAGPQGAPTTEPSGSARTNADELGEIIVTATKRAQALSDVPIAVSAVSAEQLQNSGGNDIRQLNQLAPSLLVSTATNESAGVARIRGIGTVGENPGLESSVAVFIDGVYRSRTGVGLTDLGEIDRIEVLRGPQGTLFGRNASAGLINIITKQPSFEPGGTLEASYGNFDAIRVQGSVTGPVVGDKIAARIDGVYFKRDGFLTDVISGRDLNDRDRFLVRGQLLIEPSDDLSIRLIGDYNQKNEECCGAAYIAPARNVVRAPDFATTGNVSFAPNTFQGLIQSLGGVVPLPTNSDKYVRRMGISPAASYDQEARDWGVSGEINYDIGDLSLTSITGYRVYKNASAQDGDFNVLDILNRFDQDRKFETFSQELRLQGTLFSDRLDFLIGGYYSDETLTVDDDIKYGFDYERFVNAQLGGQLYNVALAAGFPRAPGSLLNGTGVVRNVFEQSSRNYAVFTHNVIQIIPDDRLTLTLGARYTNEKKELESSFSANNDFCGVLRRAPAFTGPFAALQGAARAGATALSCVINNTAGPGFGPDTPGTTKKEDEITGTAVLSFKPVDELLAYVSYSRGYKAGGFNLDTSALNAAAPSPFNLQFEPEIVDAYEVGAKLDLRAFKLNMSIFRQDFEDFQLNTFNGVNFEVANIGSCKDDLGGADQDTSATTGSCAPDRTRPGVRSQGVELEALMFPGDDFTVTAGLTYADTAYRNNLTGVDGRPLAPTLFQLPGRKLSNSSEYVVTGSFAWTPQVSDTFSALVYADFRYQSDINTGSDLDLEKFQDGFLVVNARLGFYGPEKRWGVELWGQNVLDKKYQQIAADAPLQGGGGIRAVQQGFAASANGLFITFPAEPRTYGITVRTRF